MAETKWTPGPWRVEGNDVGGWQVWCANDGHPGLCICQRSDWPHYADQSAANARLIAAAPDLAKVCEELVAAIIVDGSAQNNPAFESDDAAWLVERARSALAKARGEPA